MLRLLLLLSFCLFGGSIVQAQPLGPERPASAQAQPALEVAVTVIQARPSGPGVAPELAKLAKYLKSSFKDYTGFSQLAAHRDTATVGRDVRITLPNASTLVYRLEGWRGDAAELKVEVGGLESTVRVQDGGRFFQAGQSYDGGMIVLAFEVHTAR